MIKVKKKNVAQKRRVRLFDELSFRHPKTGEWVVPCCYCKIPFTYRNITLEHLLARCLGGTNKKENLALSCKRCNSQKGGVEAEEIDKIRKGPCPKKRELQILIKHWTTIRNAVKMTGDPPKVKKVQPTQPKKKIKKKPPAENGREARREAWRKQILKQISA